MATPNRRDPEDPGPARETIPERSVGLIPGWVGRRATSAVCWIAFWTAVFLPFAALAVLLTGIESLRDWALFGGLVASNAVSLYLGHSYKRG